MLPMINEDMDKAEKSEGPSVSKWLQAPSGLSRSRQRKPLRQHSKTRRPNADCREMTNKCNQCEKIILGGCTWTLSQILNKCNQCDSAFLGRVDLRMHMKPILSGKELIGNYHFLRWKELLQFIWWYICCKLVFLYWYILLLQLWALGGGLHC